MHYSFSRHPQSTKHELGPTLHPACMYTSCSCDLVSSITSTCNSTQLSPSPSQRQLIKSATRHTDSRASAAFLTGSPTVSIARLSTLIASHSQGPPRPGTEFQFSSFPIFTLIYTLVSKRLIYGPLLI